jgi:hypothetical protein
VLLGVAGIITDLTRCSPSYGPLSGMTPDEVRAEYADLLGGGS